MTIRKIDLMHKQFGSTPGKKCKDCSNLRGHPGSYYKCSVYGRSASEATDWALRWEACGMFGREWNGKPIVELVKHRKRFIEEEQIEGQQTLF